MQCVAPNKGHDRLLPVKSGKKPATDRYFNYFFIISNGYTWLNKRTGKDIWNSLYEFPLIETDLSGITWRSFLHMHDWHDLFGDVTVKNERILSEITNIS